MQVDPIKPMLKPPGTRHLKLKCDELLSSFALKFHVRCFTLVFANAMRATNAPSRANSAAAAAPSPSGPSWRHAAAGRGLHSFPLQLNLSSSVHRVTQLDSRMCPGVAQVEL